MNNLTIIGRAMATPRVYSREEGDLTIAVAAVLTSVTATMASIATLIAVCLQAV
jgi:hypothetical protein